MQRRARYDAIFLWQLTLIARRTQSRFTAAICHLPFAIHSAGRGQKNPLSSCGGEGWGEEAPFITPALHFRVYLGIRAPACHFFGSFSKGTLVGISNSFSVTAGRRGQYCIFLRSVLAKKMRA